MSTGVLETGRWSRRHRHARERLPATALFGALGLIVWHSSGGSTALLSPLAAAPSSPSAAAEDGGATSRSCEDIRVEMLKKVSPRIARWEKTATDGSTINNFGGQASRLLNRTLATFDQSARQLGEGETCGPEREALAAVMQEQLHSIFLVQRSTIEQVLYQRLKKDLLRRMRRKKGELIVKDKLRMLHASMSEYDSQVRELLPFFVQNPERDRAERRLSELQWGIAETPEAKEMLQRWKMERLRRTPMRQSKGLSVSLSPGLRLMFRPSGFGNLQLYSRRQVGPPHNPNEVAVGVLNDGNVMDVYNKKPKPPLIKFQPMLGVDVSAG
eukprot:CAMPEP_0168401132 /NCGR_PEP_ID=MMETSP0228-20121227/22951_1 /TAXON_ID=133427 /ORGANISM="Protoceratium reticulatum, Strain CCCM 535 (=CCMP 1889)" /LENGTH=327 /DNA_ID=CAMNT_0008414685 /DNA_START=51 /DNA_END=1034 /DNA_ORIENTATION=+